MNSILSFAELTHHLQNINNRKRLAVANPVDQHSLEAVLLAVEKGIIDAYLIGDVKAMKLTGLLQQELSENLHFIHIPDAVLATKEAVRMVKNDEADILMKGLVTTDVILKEVLNRERGLLPAGNVLSFNAVMEIPSYHKLLFLADPAVIPSPNKRQRVAIIKYCINTAKKFGIERPKIALIHATEKANTKIIYMQDYLDILEMWENGEFGDVIMDGPLDIFLAVDPKRGKMKNVDSPVLGDADILIFPNFESANPFYKSLMTFGGAEVAGMLQGTEKPVVLTSRGDSFKSKFYSIAMACIMA